MKIRTGGPTDAADCYAGDSRRLVRQYLRLGFTPTETFEVEQPNGTWPGQILEIRV